MPALFSITLARGGFSSCLKKNVCISQRGKLGEEKTSPGVLNRRYGLKINGIKRAKEQGRRWRVKTRHAACSRLCVIIETFFCMFACIILLFNFKKNTLWLYLLGILGGDNSGWAL
jgi:hypothetical protein